jgi:tetratricopeptide (TPR) repeat protein
VCIVPNTLVFNMHTIIPETLEGILVFMQDIRRATKKHRKVLLAVVIMLMVGLVGFFGVSGRGGQYNTGRGESGEPSDNSTEGEIDSYKNRIALLEADATDYSGYMSVALAYMDLGYFYLNKYRADSENIPELDPPILDEEGNEIPLGPIEQTKRAADEAARDKAIAAADAWLEGLKNAGAEAEKYFQQALDNAPEELNEVGVANIKANQAQARDMQGDTEGSLALMKEAYELMPDNINYLVALASLQKGLDLKEDALSSYEKALELYPENVSFIREQASLHADLDHKDKARELFQQARALEPGDFNTAYAFAQFLLFADSAEAGMAELQAYRDALTEGDPNIEQAEQAIAYLQSWADMLASFNTSNVEVDDDDHDHDHDHDHEGAEIEDDDADTDGGGVTDEGIIEDDATGQK